MPTQKSPSRRQFLKSAMLGLSAAGVPALLAGCGAAPAATSSDAPVASSVANASVDVAPSVAAAAPSSTSAVELQWWIVWGGPAGEAAKKISRTFTENNPGITVNVLPVGDVVQKTLAAMAAGEAPDMFNTHENHPTFVTSNSIRPLDEYLVTSTAFKEDNYVPEMLNTLKWCDRMYGVPAVEGDLWWGLMYNKALFESAGLDPDKPPTTLEELRAASDAITRFDSAGNIEVVGFDPLDGMAGAPFAWAAAFDTTWIADDQSPKINNPENIAIVDYVSGFYQQYGAEKFGSFRQTNSGWTGPDSGFVREKQAMMLMGSFGPGEIAKHASPELLENIGVTWLPTKAGKKIQTGTFIGVALTTASEHPDEAWTFMDYLMTDDVADIMFKDSGIMTFSRSYAEKAAADLAALPGGQWYADSFTSADTFYQHKLHPINKELTDRWNKAVGEVNFGRMDAETAMNDVQNEIDKAFAGMKASMCGA